MKDIRLKGIWQALALITFFAMVCAACAMRPAPFQLLSPEKGAVVQGSVQITVAVPLEYKASLPRWDEVEVKFFIDDKLQETKVISGSEREITWLWDTSTISNGPHLIRVETITYEAGRKGSLFREVRRLHRRVTVQND